MKIYLGMIIAIILVAIIIYYKRSSDKQLKTKNKIFLIISFLLLFIVMGFRTENVGTDTSLYCRIFQNNIHYKLYLSEFTFNDTMLYILYNKFVAIFSSDKKAIIVANSLIICTLTATFIYNNSKNVVFPTIYFLLFYHFFSAMNISRQYISILLVANAFVFLKNKKLVPYILICVLATLIHNTAIISFALLPWFFIKPNKKNIIIYLIIVFIMILFFNSFLTLFSSIFTHYEMYFKNSLLREVGENRKIIITLIYFFFSFLFGSILRRKDLDENEKIEWYLLYIINLLSIIVGIVALKIMLMSRIELYFSIFSIIYIPKIFDELKYKSIWYLGFTCIMIIPMYIQLLSNNSGVLPYHNWFINI